MKWLSTGALAVVAIGAVGAVVLIAVPSASVEAVAPVERARRSFSQRVAARIRGAWRGSAACAENIRLRREIAELVQTRAEFDRLESENARLRRVLAYAAKTPEQWVAAEVLSRDGGAAGVSRTLRVGKGLSDGVAKGAVVVVPEGLVGRVRSVSPRTAEIELLSDPSVKVACEIETLSGTRPRGILMAGDENLTLRYLRPEKIEIASHSRVLTSGLGGVFPPGIEVGRYLGEGVVLPSVESSTLEDVFIRCAK